MAADEGENIGEIARMTEQAITTHSNHFEIRVIDGASTDDTVARAPQEGARPRTIVVGSRCIVGGGYSGPLHRDLLPRGLSMLLPLCLRIPVAELSGEYCVYAREAKEPTSSTIEDLSVLLEILIRGVNNEFEIREVSLQYHPRKEGTSKARSVAFAHSPLAMLRKMRILPNDCTAANYEDRAINSLNLIQRWWQGKRFLITQSLFGESSKYRDLLDISCGNTQIIQWLTHRVAFGFSPRKLRSLRHTNQSATSSFSTEHTRSIPHAENIMRANRRPGFIGNGLTIQRF